MAATIIHLILLLLSVVTITTSQNITFLLLEDQANSTLIGNIFTESRLAEKFSSDQLIGLSYDFMEIKDDHRLLFRLDSVSSNLYTNTKIDREKESTCLYSVNCYFDMKILAHNKNVFEIITVRVNITDTNDNTPRFQTDNLVLNISETAAQFSKISIEGATDLDTGPGNGIQTYSMTSQSGKNDFVLLQEDVDGNRALYISVQNVLDRETTSYYTLYLRAVDGGVPARTGTCTIHVNILDQNDNKPSFPESEISVHLDETSPANTLVKHLTATDPDDGKNGEVFYRLKSFQHKEINESFSVDSTGKLMTTRKLEYEPNKVYKVIVEAVDKGSNPLSSQIIVNVYINDIGNNAPEVSINYLSNEKINDSIVLISEKEQIDYLVAVIKVKDTDSGDNGVVTCFTYNTFFGLSKITNVDYRLIVQHVLDREKIDVHNVTVTCKDNGQPQMVGSVNFQIVLKDENDSPPRFSEYYYQVSLNENTPAGQSLLTVIATDSDAGDNAKITYEISPISDHRFTVDPNTGLVRTSSSFDRETTAHVTFEVIARDNGSPPLESKASVVVDIQDVNDNKPEFVKMIFDFNVAENMPNGTVVDSVSAIDPDQGRSGQITYALDSSASSIPFTVFPSGQIITRSTFDREDVPMYQFTVLAVDNGTLPLTSSVTVRVTITDKNDNKPIFSFPKENFNNTIRIWNSLPIDSIIATIQAFDYDNEENGNVNFFIISGDDENMFYLNPSTGSLHVKKVSTATGNKTFRLKIEARDRGYPSLNTTAELIIVVQYANITKPESKEYILIVVSVVCVTFVVAVALIAVICFLKKKSIACGKNERYMENNRPPRYDEVKGNNSNYNNPYTVQNDKNKQRVKFNEPGSTFTKQEMLDNLTLTKKDGQQRKDDTNYNFDRQKLPEESETSSKTDSGHGSEEDYNHPIDKNGRIVQNNHPYGSVSGIYVTLDKSKSNNPDIARNVPPSRDKKYLDDSLLTTSWNSVSENPSSSRHPSHSQPLSPSWHTDSFKLNFQNTTPFYMALGSIQSRDDDESTTTSGSYMVNHEDLEDDLQNRHQDLFV